MAISGYDARQGGRDTFAFEGTAPAQSRLSASGNSRGVQIVGGESQGGVVSSNANPPAMAGGLGAYFEGLLAPHLERKKQQRFFEGMTAAQSGIALEELSQSHNRLDGIFGPTGFEQGAQFYTAMSTVDQWQTGMMGRMDELVRMDTTQQAAVLAESSRAMMTGDPGADALIQTKLMEVTGPLVDTIARRRYAFQQREARDATNQAWTSSAEALQEFARQAASVTDPADPVHTAMQTQMQSFLGGMAIPHGMSEETYTGLVSDFLVNTAQAGNFYAYEALQEAGVMQHLDPDQTRRVNDAYDRYAQRALDNATGNYIEDLLRVDEGIGKTALGQEGGLSPLQAVAAVDAINARISRDTGIRRRAYDSGVLHQTGRRVIDMIASQGLRQQEREYQEGVRTRERELDAADERAEQEARATSARQALALGQPRSFLAAGGDAEALNQQAHAAYNAGSYQLLARAFANEQWTAPNLPQIMQAKLTSAGGQTFTADAALGYQQWKGLYEINSAAAEAYYGPEHLRLIEMDRLIRAGEPAAAAYTRAFAGTDAGRFSEATLRPEDRREAATAITSRIANLDSTILGRMIGVGQASMTDYSRNVLTNVVTATVANGQRNSDRPLSVIVDDAVRVAHANNSFEFYGGSLAWRNRPGTRRLHEEIGVPSDEMSAILNAELTARLQAVGLRGRHDEVNEIIPGRRRNGWNAFAPETFLTIMAGNKVVIITAEQLRERRAAMARRSQQRRRGDGRQVPQLPWSAQPGSIRDAGR